MAIATFRGMHNYVKSTILVILYNFSGVQTTDGTPAALSLASLVEVSGLKYNTLACSLGRWCRWHYIKKYKGSRGYNYAIDDRGKHFIDNRLPPILRRQIEAEFWARMKNISR